MLADSLRFLAAFLVALMFAPSSAHLLELPNKIGLGRDAYLQVQQLYSGWALLGVLVVAALFSTLALAIVVRRKRRQFRLAIGAFLCIVAAQVVFWTWTFPANEATDNWTTLPPGWEQLRTQWEYSHAAGAVLTLAAFVLLLLALLMARHDAPRRAARGD